MPRSRRSMRRLAMIAKGKIRAEGGKLASYLMTGEPGEIAQLVETRGLERFGRDPVTAFDRMEQWANARTDCQKAFFHGHIRLAPGERLSDAQWMEAVDRKEKTLGFTDAPRMVSFHIDEATGDKHLHVAWFRIDLETERAIDPGLYKNKLKHLSRECEKDFGLQIVSNERKPEHRARAAGRNEFEESRRLGTDINVTRTAILDSFQKSDNGRSFAAAIKAQGMEIAAGDRGFVIIDAAGGHHALNKKLTAMTLGEIRQRLADLDMAQLPTVDAAKNLQHDRKYSRENSAEKDRPMTDDRDSTSRPDDAGKNPYLEDAPPNQFPKAAFDTTEPDAKFREAWRQPAFSEATIEADPWTAVYLPIPQTADATLLMKGVEAAAQCQDMARYPGAGPQLQQSDAGPTDHAHRASERIHELSEAVQQLFRVREPFVERGQAFTPAEPEAGRYDQLKPAAEPVQGPEASPAPAVPVIETSPAGGPSRGAWAEIFKGMDRDDAADAIAYIRACGFDQQSSEPPSVLKVPEPQGVAEQKVLEGYLASYEEEFGYRPAIMYEDKGFTPDPARGFVYDAADAVDRAIRTSSNFLASASALVENLIGYLGDLISPPPPMTRGQIETAVKVADEKAVEAADSAAYRENEAAYDAQDAQRRQASDERLEELKRLYGNDISVEDPRERGRDWGREQERDRER